MGTVKRKAKVFLGLGILFCFCSITLVQVGFAHGFAKGLAGEPTKDIKDLLTHTQNGLLDPKTLYVSIIGFIGLLFAGFGLVGLRIIQKEEKS